MVQVGSMHTFARKVQSVWMEPLKLQVLLRLVGVVQAFSIITNWNFSYDI